MEGGKFDEWEFPEKIQVIKSAERKEVQVKGQAYMRWRSGDETAERMAIVQLYELGIGTQEELAKAFGIHVNSVGKYVSEFKADGGSGLISMVRGPKQSWKVIPEVRAKILITVLKEGVREYGAIQKKLEGYWHKRVSKESIRQVLLEDGLVKERIKVPGAEQGELFGG